MTPPDRRVVQLRAPRRVLAVAAALAVGLVPLGCSVDRSSGERAEPGVARAAELAPVVSGDLPEELSVARPRTVAMVGDSITVAAAEHLDDALADLGLEVLAIDAQIGRRMTIGERDRLHTGADIVEFVTAEQQPELWIVALGTNDIGQYPDVDTVVVEVEELLARIPDDIPVVWVDTWIRGRDEQTGVVNAAIRAALADRPDSTVVAWSDHADADGVIAADGVHLTDGVGRERFAAVVAAGIAPLVLAPTPIPTTPSGN